MALQKWAAPAGSPLLATATVAGDPGNQSLAGIDYLAYASDGDIAIGATLKAHMAGTLTTTGAPTAAVVLGLFGLPLDSVNATPSGVTDRPWYVDATATVRSVDAAGTRTISYSYRIVGLFATDVVAVGTTTAGSGVGALGLVAGWDSGTDDADSGDIINIIVADALWIG